MGKRDVFLGVGLVYLGEGDGVVVLKDAEFVDVCGGVIEFALFEAVGEGCEGLLVLEGLGEGLVFKMHGGLSLRAGWGLRGCSFGN